MKSATQEINWWSSSNSFVNTSIEFVPVCFNRRATLPKIIANTTMPITFVSAAAWIGLLGISARNVSTIGLISRIFLPDSTISKPWPKPKAFPKIRPTIAATATMPRFVEIMATTNFLRLAPASMCKITWTIEIKTIGITSMRIKSMKPPPTRENHFVLSLM